MTKLLKNLAIISGIILGLKAIGSLINALPIWNWLTQFFIFIKMITAPLDFLWNFQTTWQIITTIFTILIAYSVIQGYLVIRDNFKD